jgi:hypothetical protein
VSFSTADKREFLRISQAVGMGFLIMGVIGYIVKLSKSHVLFFLFESHVSRARELGLGGVASKSRRRGMEGGDGAGETGYFFGALS